MTTHRWYVAVVAALLTSPLVCVAQETLPVVPNRLPENMPAPLLPEMAPLTPFELPTSPPVPTLKEMAPLTPTEPPTNTPVPTPRELVPVAPAAPHRTPTSMPAPPSAGSTMPNPALAHAIARMFRESGRLSQYRIHVYAYGNNLDLIGEVADERQHEMVLQLLRTVPGLAIVRDWIQVRPPLPSYLPAPSDGGQRMVDYSPYPYSGLVPVQGPPVLKPLPGPIPPIGDGKGVEKGSDPRIDGQLPEPQPIFQAPHGPNPMIQPPPMPPYAWPTFAPYNNYSRVAYPNAYPYEQWPFIGPIYPFPRVPLGWRSVSLTWEDGHWWYHRNPTGHDWWRIRYH